MIRASLEEMQSYADKCSDKLRNNTKPVLRWATSNCWVGKDNHAHCHVSDGQYPRGVICVNAEVANLSVNEWHHSIAHEIVHLVVKSSHYSVRFARRMIKLRFTKFYSAVILNSGKRR